MPVSALGKFGVENRSSEQMQERGFQLLAECGPGNEISLDLADHFPLHKR